MSATFTNAGLNLIASAVQAPGINHAITYIGIGPGCGTLSAGLTSGVAAGSIGLDAALPANLAGGTVLVITDGTNTDTATVVGGGALAGATSIALSGYTPAHTYAAHTTVVAPQMGAGDTALYAETVRVPTGLGSAGGAAGESLNSAYFDASIASAIYIQVGYFGGDAAMAATGTGTLMAEDTIYWNHTVNADSATYQLDNTL